MGSLIYSAIASLDGYVADERGEFGWAAPDEEVHAFVNDLERPVGTHLYGRRMYEVMVAWESDDAFPDQQRRHTRLRGDLARGRQGRVLDDPDGRGERRGPASSGPSSRSGSRAWWPAPSATSRSGARASPRTRWRPGSSTSCHLFVVPVVVGAARRGFPRASGSTSTCVDERRFASGVVHLHYRTGSVAPA